MGSSILRFVLGVLAGIVVMFLVIMGIEFAGHMIYPPPPGIDPSNLDDVATMLASAPVGALAFVVLAWVVGAFAGGFIAAKISRTWPRSAAIVTGLVVMSGVVSMMLQIPGHPMWMAILGLILPVPAALFGAWLARPKAMPSL